MNISTSVPLTLKPSAVQNVLPKGNSTATKGPDFRQVLQEITGTQKSNANQDPLDISQIERSLLRQEALTPQTLLLYQIRLGRWGTKVELFSKLAESALSCVRKLENQN